MPTDAADVALSLPAHEAAADGGVASATHHARVVARAVTEPVYALCTFAAVVTVGDPIMVAMLHAAFAAAAATGAVGSRLVPDVQRVARVTCGDDAAFIAQVTLAGAMHLFMATQVLAAPSFGLEAVLVVSALVAACDQCMVVMRASQPSETHGAAVDTTRARRAATTLVLSVAGAWLCARATGEDLRRGPSLFPLTQFDGGTACILLFFSFLSCSELRLIETKRNERIADLEARRKEALAAAAEMPAAEAPQPPKPPPVAFDAFSKAVYANAFGFLVIMTLAVAFRMSQPYEQAVLSGQAGAYLLLSCVAAAINAVVVAASEHAREDADGERKPVFVATVTRALTIVVSWHVAAQRPSAAAAAGVALCLVALAMAARHARKT